ncbi:putative reverse transcriptase domain-containing protein [Tanacetum coccineum]
MKKDEREWKGKVLTIGFLYLEMEVVCVEFGCHFEVEIEYEFTLSSLEVLQGFSFFLQMGFTLILATFDGLDVGLLEDVIGEDDCDDDDCDEEMSLDYRGVPRKVNLVNARNLTVRGRRNQGNQARGRAFMLGADDAPQDPNIVTEIEGHGFNIDLIPFGHGSLDIIIGMDWLSNYKAEIICHEKVVRIPLPDGNVLTVLGEKPEEKARFLMGVKKQEEIVVVRDFPEVFPDDLSRLPPIREIKFRIELIPGSTPVAKSPYCLAPSKMEELSGQLKELQDKGDEPVIDEATNAKVPFCSTLGLDKIIMDLRDRHLACSANEIHGDGNGEGITMDFVD